MGKMVTKKILPEYFKAVRDYEKTFELRKDEDGFEVGDTIRLAEWDNGEYTGNVVVRKITYILRDCPEYGLMPGYCILGIQSETEMFERKVKQITTKIEDFTPTEKQINLAKNIFDSDANKNCVYDCQKPDKTDNVNHPSHYTTGKIECIDFITDKKLNFCRGNAIKYIVRAGLKDPAKEVEDLKKAIFYINREIKDIESRE